jgi:hypothetical protein
MIKEMNEDFELKEQAMLEKEQHIVEKERDMGVIRK